MSGRTRWWILSVSLLAGVAVGIFALRPGSGSATAPTVSTPAASPSPDAGVKHTSHDAEAPPAMPGDKFVDVTRSSGITFTHHLVDGGMDNLIEALGPGATFFDYDNDGHLDLLFLQGGYAEGVVKGDNPAATPKNALYHNKGDGTFEDKTLGSGLENATFTTAAIAADYDGDGDIDLYVCDHNANQLFRNDGNGKFVDVASQAGVADTSCSVSAVFLDYDRDGDLDLYVANYIDFDPDYKLFYQPDGFPPPIAYEPQPHKLFRNKGDGTFEDVSVASKIALGQGRAMTAISADFDADGWPDVFVTNDMTANFLWHNNHDGTFDEVAVASGVGFGINGEATGAMTADWGDVDGDTRLDLYVSAAAYASMYSGTPEPGVFRDTTVESRLAQLTGQYVSWGGGYIDFDNDGDLDVLVVNGDLHHLVGWEDLLLENDGTGKFVDAFKLSSYFSRKLMGRGGMVADFDNDGDEDILVTNLNQPPVLLRNDTDSGNNHLSITLKGEGGNTQGFGAIVNATLDDGRTVVREMRCPTAYLGMHDPRIRIGLGKATTVKSLKVSWPDGKQTLLTDVPANRPLTINQADSNLARAQ